MLASENCDILFKQPMKKKPTKQIQMRLNIHTLVSRESILLAQIHF